jgi:hypothetical protein
MRLASTALGSFAVLFAVSSAACSVTTTEPGPDPYEATPPLPESTPTPPPEKSKTTLAKPSDTPKPASDGTFGEVVYVLMRDKKFSQWFCTGTLVAKDRVVTAAHCLDPAEFVSYEVVAPLAPSKPRVSASNPKSFGGDYDDVGQPDIGFLTLDTPITLPAYAELTDVTARVDAGEKLTAAAVVRTAEEPEAPLAMSQHLPLSSTIALGYAYGFGTPYFSNGGDSGAGLFLVENGKPTHKLIAVARQPEPDRNIDHFTRVGPPFLTWYAANNP